MWRYLSPVWALHRQRAVDLLDSVHRCRELSEPTRLERAIEISNQLEALGEDSPTFRFLKEAGHDLPRMLTELGIKPSPTHPDEASSGASTRAPRP